MKKILWMLAVATLLSVFIVVYAEASEIEEDYADVQHIIDEMLEDKSVDFQTIVEQLMAGDFEISFKSAGEYILDKTVGEMRLNRSFMGQIIGIAIIGALFTNFSASFVQKYVAETGFYVTYLVVIMILSASLYSAFSIVENVIRHLIWLMKAIVPVFCIALTASMGVTTGSAFYQVLMMAVVVMDWLMAGVVMKGIHIYVVLAMINNMTEKDYLSQMALLLKNVTGWILKTALVVTLGINMIKAMIVPAFDTVKNTVIAKMAGGIPVFGNTFSMAAKAAVASLVLLKNAIGTAGVIVIVISCAAPLLKLFIIGVMYKIVEAVIQPVSDKRLTASVHVAGEGVFLMAKALGTVLLLFVLLLAMITSSSNVFIS